MKLGVRSQELWYKSLQDLFKNKPKRNEAAILRNLRSKEIRNAVEDFILI